MYFLNPFQGMDTNYNVLAYHTLSLGEWQHIVMF